MLQVRIEDVLLRLAHLRGRLGSRWIGMRSGCGVACIAMLAMMLAGCGNSVNLSGAKAGPITVTNAAGMTGAVSSLVVGSTIKLSMTPASDSSHAGVDWTVTCAGNPVTGSRSNGACGTLAPSHTADGVATVYTAPSTSPINGW